MQLPSKSQKGVNARNWLVDAVDRLIDCVMSMRLRPGPGIKVKETPAGTIISLAEQSGQPKTSTPAAMVKAGEGIRIDNGTASSIYVPGSTSSAVPVNGATFTCVASGSTSGESGWIPNWGWNNNGIGNATSEIFPNVQGQTVSHTGWLYAFADLTSYVVYACYASVHLVVNGAMFKVASLGLPEGCEYSIRVGGSVGPFPVLAGSTVSFIVSTVDSHGFHDANAFGVNAGCVYYADTGQT